MDGELKAMVEVMRRHLAIRFGWSSGNLQDPGVIKMSQHLDLLITAQMRDLQTETNESRQSEMIQP